MVKWAISLLFIISTLLHLQDVNERSPTVNAVGADNVCGETETLKLLQFRVWNESVSENEEISGPFSHVQHVRPNRGPHKKGPHKRSGEFFARPK